MQRCPTCNSFFDDAVSECPYDKSKLVAVAIGGQQKTTDLVGRSLEGRFQINAVIGEGGMGRVYKGIDTTTNLPVAVKVLHREISSDERSVKRFMSEARILQSLSHPHIIRLYAFGRADDGLLYIAMEFLDGKPADVLIKERALSRPEVISILDQVCDALSEAHLQGIIHRDLKPANIFISQREGKAFVTVLDFGIAKVAGGQSLTVTGKVMGTPSYMAPEQIAGKQPNPRVDIYALGILAYELLCGRPPFVADMPIELLYLHLHEPPPPINTLLPPNQPISQQMSDILLNLLAKAPEDRPKNTVEVRSLLKPFIEDPSLLAPSGAADPSAMATLALDGEQAEAMHLSNAQTRRLPPVAGPLRPDPTSATAAPSTTGRRPAPPVEATPKRRIWPWIVLLLVAVVVAVGLAVTIFVVLTNLKAKSELDQPTTPHTAVALR